MTSLAGAKVVVTRSSEDSDTLASLLEARGAEVIRLPTIAIEFPDDLLDAASDPAARLAAGDYAWVVCSSRPGVIAFERMMSRYGVDPGVVGSVKAATVGAATRATFEESFGRSPDVIPASFTGSDLVAAIGVGPGRVLLPRPVTAPRTIVEELSAQGWQPDEVPLYRTVQGEPSSDSVERVRAGDFDVLTFTSGSTVRFFLEIVGHVGIQERQRIVVIGPSTEAVAKELGFEVDGVADPHTTEGVVSAVEAVVGR